ncbi:hypothetical protein FNV43_RR06319 [Rhamnella rubrinervis]|uniref:Fatty acid hydroxylase domain-containing protein n=1 Tax=Rhamnella rubrinervis TaxID=2594499 RepID=A0A8K0HEB1_9ROSA|nr:hypothetical protein FNV43_RR06319 [Rhamnella rubrinervis]
MVGDSTYLAACSMLVSFHLFPKGPYSSSSSLCISWWRLHLDIAGVWTVTRALSTPSTAPALFGGIVLGYVMYDLTHYYLHHGKPSKAFTQNLKRYHLNHHFRIRSSGFGITSPIWDSVFGTLPPTKAAL